MSTATANLVDDLLQESHLVRARYHAQWKRNNDLFESRHYASEDAPRANVDRFIINKINRSTVAMAAVLAASRPRISIKPTEYGDRAVFYVVPELGAQILAAQPGNPLAALHQQFEAEQLLGHAPILPQQAQVLAQLVGEAGIVKVNDQLVADAMGQVHDTMWDRGGHDFVWATGTQNKLVIGHQPYVAYWNAREERWEFCTFNPKNCWIDPNCQYIDKAQYFFYAQYVDQRKAKADYPKWSGQIERNGNSEVSVFGFNDIPGLGENLRLQYRRDMVTIVTGWIRDELVDVPMSPQDAVQQHLVGQSPEGYLDAQGQPTKPGLPTWPTQQTRGIKQIVRIGNEVVDERLAPFRDIPVSWDVNLPMAFTPYAMGEPELLADTQMALNRIMSIHINHTKFFQAPLEIMTQSARDALGDKVDSMYSFAGRRMVFPDAVWQRANGNPMAFYNPPPINESYVRMYELLAAEFERTSLQTTAMQGNSDPHAQSGRAIGLLQSAAQNVITYRAIWAERALSTLARVTIPMIADFLDENGWKRYTSKYPPAILAAIQSRAKNLEYDVQVEIEAGKGSLQRQRFQDALTLRAATGGVMPSLRTLLERSGEYDTEDEMNRVAQEQGASAQARQTQAAAAGGQPTPSQ